MAIELRLPEPALTEETLIALSRDNPGYRFERSAGGKLVVSPPTGFVASGGKGNLFYQVSHWSELSGLGEAYPPTAGVTRPDTSIRAPDATYVTNDALDALTPEDYLPAFVRVVPDAVFELVSPSDDPAETERKLTEYLANRVRVAVMLDPVAKTVTIARRGVKWTTYVSELVEIGPEMPAFVLNAAAVFRRFKRRGER